MRSPPQLLSSADPILQPSDIELSLNASRRTFGAHPPFIPCTTARHNLATSFTRALLATHIHHAHSSKRHHARLNMRPSVLCIRSTMSNSQRTKATIRRSSTHVLNFSSFSRGQNLGVRLVEPNGIEPMTSCLQSRRSPS